MFLNRNMSVIAYANGFTLWHYKSNEESLEQIEQAGYFNKVYTLMGFGDIIIINAKDGTAIRAVKELSPNVTIGQLS